MVTFDKTSLANWQMDYHPDWVEQFRAVDDGWWDMILARMPMNATAGLKTAAKQDADECSHDGTTPVKDLVDRLMHG